MRSASLKLEQISNRSISPSGKVSTLSSSPAGADLLWNVSPAGKHPLRSRSPAGADLPLSRSPARRLCCSLSSQGARPGERSPARTDPRLDESPAGAHARRKYMRSTSPKLNLVSNQSRSPSGKVCLEQFPGWSGPPLAHISGRDRSPPERISGGSKPDLDQVFGSAPLLFIELMVSSAWEIAPTRAGPHLDLRPERIPFGACLSLMRSPARTDPRRDESPAGAHARRE